MNYDLRLEVAVGSAVKSSNPCTRCRYYDRPRLMVIIEVTYTNYIYCTCVQHRGQIAGCARSAAQRDPAGSKQHAREKALTRYAIRKNGTAVCGAMAQERQRGPRSGRGSRGRDGTSACRDSLS